MADRYGNRKIRRGSLSYPEAETVGETLSELSILLTGGRLTQSNLDLVANAYKSQGLQAAQKVIVMTPEFHNYGNPEGHGKRPPIPHAPPKPPSSYKAAVMVFFHGGADTYHMLVPTDCSLYQEYAEMRKGCELNPDALRKITTRR